MLTAGYPSSQAVGKENPGRMTTQATLASSFTKAAVKFNVAESDYLVMKAQGITTFESLTYRLPKSESLEEFLQGTIAPNAGYKEDDDSITVFKRAPAVTWRDFQAGEDAGALRKLWAYSKEVCKADLEAMAGGDSDRTRAKVNVTTSTAMEAAAIKKGMPQPVSDAERPSLFSLSKAQQALSSPGASFEHLSWEMFISSEEEGRLIRQGKMPKGQPELILGKGDKLSLKEQALSPPVEQIEGIDRLRRCLDLRARAYCMIEAAEFSTYRLLNDRYFSKLQSTTPEGMRNPSINEIRRFDRVLHEDILRWLSRDTGDLNTAILYHLENDHLSLWRLLDPVMSSLPDQGIERAAEKDSKKRKSPEPPGGGKAPEGEEVKARGKRKCLVCGVRHTPLCTLTPEIRKKMRDEQKKAKEDKKKAADKTDKEKKK